MAGNILLKGYTAAIATCLTTELNSITDGQTSALSAEITNATNLDIYADFQLHLASVTIGSTAAFVTIFMVTTPDGTQYPNWDTGAYLNYQAQYYAATILVKNATSAVFDGATNPPQSILLPPGKFKIAVRNSTGSSFPSSGNTLSIRTYADSYT